MAIYQDESDLIKFLNKLDEESEDTKKDFDKRVNENLDLMRGKQWKLSRNPYFLYNIIESAVEDKIGKLSETRPTIRIMPIRNGLEAPSDMIHKAISSIWDRRKIEYRTERLALYGVLCGAVFVGTPWNSDLEQGLGDIDFIVKDPRMVGTDRAIVQADQTDMGEYVIIEDTFPLDLVKARYPGRAADLKPAERTIGIETPRAMTAGERIKAAGKKMFGRGERPASVIPRTWIREYYVQDRRRSIDDDGVVPMVRGLTESTQDKGIPFPGGRRILRAGNTILKDTYNPFWDGYYPVDMLSWKMDLESVWGPDEVQAVKRLQDAINRLGDAYTKTAIINSVVRMILDSGALSPDERNKLSNTIGEIIEKAPGRELSYQVPPLLAADVVSFIKQCMEWAREKIGVVQSPAQKDLPSIVTGPAIEGLQLMVETPIRTSARRIEEFYQRVGQKLISRVFQFYTSDRLLQLIGPSKEWMSFEFVRRNLIVDGEGNPRSQEDIRKAYKDFYFAVEPGSSLAITRVQRAMLKMQLAENGWLHPKEVLEEAGFKNPEEKLQEAQDAQKGGLFDAFLNKDGRKNNGSVSSPLNGSAFGG